MPYSHRWVTNYDDESMTLTAGFIGSITTCLDYLIDEMSISGGHTVT